MTLPNAGLPSSTWIGCERVNYTIGRRGHKVLAIVIHIMAGTLKGTDDWFNNPISGVSAHYGIGKQGYIHQYVRQEDAAHHCGKVVDPSWPLLVHGVNPNMYTVGIEHEGTVDDVWTPEMYNTSSRIIFDVATRWSLPIDRDHIIKHHEIRSNKPCPGPKCDMDRLIQCARLLEL